MSHDGGPDVTRVHPPGISGPPRSSKFCQNDVPEARRKQNLSTSSPWRFRCTEGSCIRIFLEGGRGNPPEEAKDYTNEPPSNEQGPSTGPPRPRSNSHMIASGSAEMMSVAFTPPMSDRPRPIWQLLASVIPSGSDDSGCDTRVEERWTAKTR